MAIRLRTVAGKRIALCAAESDPIPGDIYLDDGDHCALTEKNLVDWAENGLLPPPEKIARLALLEKVAEAARDVVGVMDDVDSGPGKYEAAIIRTGLAMRDALVALDAGKE